jgi:hypothetical protein
MTGPDEHFSDAEFREMLTLLDHRVPRVDANDVILRARPARSWRSALLAASAVFAVATVAAATVPGSWMARLTERVRQAPSAVQGTPAPTGAAASTAGSRGIAFVPGEEVDVQFRATQPSGAVQVRWANDSSVLLTQTGAEGDAHYSLTPTGVIVENEGSTASYSLVLPRTIAHARVRVAGREVLAKHADTISCGGSQDAKGVCTIVLAGTREK